MDGTEIFSAKARKYAIYRWDYAPKAIERIFEVTGIGLNSTIADIGAGTGILTRHFAGRCGRLYAVEPNSAMRAFIEPHLRTQTGCVISDGRAEKTGLPDESIDLIAVAQALNWFDPQRTRDEFRRILKPCGWLAAIRNVGTYGEMDAALEKVYPKETETTNFMKGKDTPASFYMTGKEFIQGSFSFRKAETWDEFFGSLGTASYAPDENSVLWNTFEQAARQVFDQFSTGGQVVSEVETRLCLGKIA